MQFTLKQSASWGPYRVHDWGPTLSFDGGDRYYYDHGPLSDAVNMYYASKIDMPLQDFLDKVLGEYSEDIMSRPGV